MTDMANLAGYAEGYRAGMEDSLTEAVPHLIAEVRKAREEADNGHVLRDRLATLIRNHKVNVNSVRGAVNSYDWMNKSLNGEIHDS